MGNISSWLQGVSDRVPGAQKLDVDAAVRSVIREFCTKTLLWVKQLTAIDIIDGTASYTLTAATDQAIVTVERVEVNGLYVPPTSMDVLDREIPSWRDEESSQPSTFMVDAEKVLRLREIPTENITAGLVVWVAVKPSPTTDTIPDFIFNDWYETILDGAVSYLLKMPNKVWSNIQGGEYYNDYYKADLSEAKNRKVTGKTKLSIRVQQQPFYVV